MLAFPDFDRNFVLETDASVLGLGAILSQIQEDGNLHPLAYASRSLSKSEKNYSATDLETLAVVWAVTHFRYYLYGHQVTIYTDHTAVKAVLETPNLTGKHARWWSKIHGSGIGVNIVHRAGKENRHADALSHQPVMPAPTEKDEEADLEVQVVKIVLTDVPDTLDELLRQQPTSTSTDTDDLIACQLTDPCLEPIILYLKDGRLPENEQQAQEIITLSKQFTILDEILYRENSKGGELPQIVIPASLKQQMMEEHHAGLLAGHFSGPRLYKTISKRWW